MGPRANPDSRRRCLTLPAVRQLDALDRLIDGRGSADDDMNGLAEVTTALRELASDDVGFDQDATWTRIQWPPTDAPCGSLAPLVAALGAADPLAQAERGPPSGHHGRRGRARGRGRRAGSWEAERIDRRTEFEVEFGVEPDAIAAGHENRVVYTLDVFNVGDHAAVGAHASFAALPPFFHPAQILISPLDAALDGDAATDAANVPTLEIPLGTIEPGAVVRVQLIGSATPEREGRFTSIANVAAENAERAMARTVLEVEGSSLTAASAFVPSTVTSGGDRRVIHIVSLQGSALGNGVVFVKSSPLGELLRERTTFVFGALWEGSLTEGMEIFSATTDFGSVQIIVTGTVGSLDAGHYETTVVAEGGSAHAESTAGLLMVARDDDRGFESEPSERDFDDDDAFDDDEFDDDDFDGEEPEHELFEERDEDDEGEEEDQERDGPAPLLDVAHALEELQAEISEFFGGDLRQRLIELLEEARVAADKGNTGAT